MIKWRKEERKVRSAEERRVGSNDNLSNVWDHFKLHDVSAYSNEHPVYRARTRHEVTLTFAVNVPV